MTVGQRVRARRLELGMTVDELADKIGKNRATVYRYESGEIESMPISVLESLARVLRTTPGDLLAPGNEPPMLTRDESDILETYRSLNQTGKIAAKAQLKVLAAMPEYSKDGESSDMMDV